MLEPFKLDEVAQKITCPFLMPLGDDDGRIRECPMRKRHCVGGNATGSTTNSLNKNPGQRRRLGSRILSKDLDGVIDEVRQEGGLSVVARAGGKGRIKHALVGQISYIAEQILHGRTEGPEGAGDLLAFLERTTITADESNDGITLGWVEDSRVYRQLIRGYFAEVPVEAQHLFNLGQWVDHHPSPNCRTNGVELIFEGGHDAEVTAAAA